jgi:hypothetical protein
MEQTIPKPAAEIDRLLKILDGRWNMKVTYAPSPLLPEGGDATGQETSSSGPGGFSVVVDTLATGPGEFAFKAMGFIIWDDAEGVYRLYWFSSISPVASLFTGTWEDKDLSFVGTETIMGQTMSSRHRISNIKPDSFDYAIDMGPSSDKLERAITIQYSRATG